VRSAWLQRLKRKCHHSFQIFFKFQDARIKSTCFQRWKLTYDALLSSFAFDLKLRPYQKVLHEASRLGAKMPPTPRLPTINCEVGRCRLTLSNPR
jgi:hypothetical protein